MLNCHGGEVPSRSRPPRSTPTRVQSHFTAAVPVPQADEHPCSAHAVASCASCSGPTWPTASRAADGRVYFVKYQYSGVRLSVALCGMPLGFVGDLGELVVGVRLPEHRELVGQVVRPVVEVLQAAVAECLGDQRVVRRVAVPAGVGRRAALEQLLAGRQVVRGERPAAAPVGHVPPARGLSYDTVVRGQRRHLVVGLRRLSLIPIDARLDCSRYISDASQANPVAYGMAKLSGCRFLIPGPPRLGLAQPWMRFGITSQPLLVSSAFAFPHYTGTNRPACPAVTGTRSAGCPPPGPRSWSRICAAGRRAPRFDSSRRKAPCRRYSCLMTGPLPVVDR